MKFNQEQLEKFELEIIEKGYRKYQGHYKREDYAYWKGFDISYNEYEDKKIGYQIALMIYDFSIYPQNTSEFPISVSFEFLLGNTTTQIARVDLSISDENLTVEKFEEICEKFYNTICKQWK